MGSLEPVKTVFGKVTGVKDDAKRRQELLQRVSTLKQGLLLRAALPEAELKGYLPQHYRQAAQALDALEQSLVSGESIDDAVESALFRAFYRASELVQLKEEELVQFRNIYREVHDLMPQG